MVALFDECPTLSDDHAPPGRNRNRMFAQPCRRRHLVVLNDEFDEPLLRGTFSVRHRHGHSRDWRALTIRGVDEHVHGLWHGATAIVAEASSLRQRCWNAHPADNTNLHLLRHAANRCRCWRVVTVEHLLNHLAPDDRQRTSGQLFRNPRDLDLLRLTQLPQRKSSSDVSLTSKLLLLHLQRLLARAANQSLQDVNLLLELSDALLGGRSVLLLPLCHLDGLFHLVGHRLQVFGTHDGARTGNGRAHAARGLAQL